MPLPGGPSGAGGSGGPAGSGGPVGAGGSGEPGAVGGPVGSGGAGGPRPLAAEADRERLLALLREHYATGLLGHEDLDRRVGMVLAARYLDEAAAAVADLPGVQGAGPASGVPSAGAASGAAAVPGSTAGQSKPRRVRRGHAHADQPAAGWIPTDERFRDPTSRAIMRVWIDPADQTRHYVPEPGP
ncbi:MAG TPA: DUF1707 domain-containing protein [Streptosporangiaceae bacterium]|nr:DUF1707 domain-containing protein [Streptosporangiaceae bacterium]